MLHFVEILRAARAESEARFALGAAPSIHPQLSIPDTQAQAGDSGQL
jgi:hypothetical protein